MVTPDSNGLSIFDSLVAALLQPLLLDTTTQTEVPTTDEQAPFMLPLDRSEPP